MNLSEAVNAAVTLKEKAIVVWQHYESRKLQSELEPKWIHAGYEIVFKYINGSVTPEEKQFVQEIVSSHSLKDGYSVAAFPGTPSGPMRIIHDGWKSGTPTWIFMGRAEPGAAKMIGDGWVAVQRSLPAAFYQLMDQKAAPPTLWIAYHLEKQMGVSAMTSNCIGPATSYDELLGAVNDEL